MGDPEKLRREKEQEAWTQTAAANWQVAAGKWLNGGRLLRSPMASRLARLSRISTGPDGVNLTVNPNQTMTVAADDMITPRFYSDELADRIPGAKLIVLEGGGHFAPNVLPAPYTAAVGTFLRSL